MLVKCSRILSWKAYQTMNVVLRRYRREALVLGCGALYILACATIQHLSDDPPSSAFWTTRAGPSTASWPRYSPFWAGEKQRQMTVAPEFGFSWGGLLTRSARCSGTLR